MDRLIKMVDDYIKDKPAYSCSAQIGESQYLAHSLKTQQWFKAEEFQDNILAADVFISHAGIGNIMLASELKKPIVVVARTAQYNEHINNHQKGTVKGFANRDFVFIAESEQDLAEAIDAASKWSYQETPPNARLALLTKLEHYLEQ